MGINTDYISKRGKSYKISKNFALEEMQCKDRSDKVLWSTDLMQKLEKLRAYGGFTIAINSGFRTSTYNKKIGGASSSQHIKGTAADIVVKKDGVIVDGKKVCCICQDLGFKGIGYISANSTHVDMRTSGSYRGDERKGYSGNVGNDFYKYFKIDRATIQNMKQEEEEVTQKQFNEMMENYLKDLTAQEPSNWSAEERAWGESVGLIKGDSNGQKQYKAFCTREQLITFLYRFKNLIK